MEAVISAHALKTFVRALGCLAKFGDNLSIQADGEEGVLKLSIINSSNSAFAIFVFDAPFFDSFTVTAWDDKSKGKRLTECQVQVKSILSILRHRNVDRSVESCDMNVVEGDGESPQCRLVFRLHCKHGVLKTHRLTYSSTPALVAMGDPISCPHTFFLRPGIAHEWMEHFTNAGGGGGGAKPRGGGNSAEITFDLGPSGCKMRSELLDGDGGRDLTKKPMQTAIRVETDEFEGYDVSDNVQLTFSLKEFKAIIQFADGVSVPLEAHFTAGGEALFFSLYTEAFSTDFVLSTSLSPSQVKAQADHRSAQSTAATIARARPSATPSQAPNATAPTAGDPRPVQSASRASGVPRTLSQVPHRRLGQFGGGRPAAASIERADTGITTEEGTSRRTGDPPAGQPVFTADGVRPRVGRPRLEMDIDLEERVAASRKKDSLGTGLFVDDSSEGESEEEEFGASESSSSADDESMPRGAMAENGSRRPKKKVRALFADSQG